MTYVAPPSVSERAVRTLRRSSWRDLPFGCSTKYYSTTFALREASGELKFSSQEDRIIKLVMYRFIDHLMAISIAVKRE